MLEIRTCIDRRPVPDKNTRLAALTAALWGPGFNLPIAFMDGEQTLQDRVQAAAVEWTKFADIKFVFIKDPSVAEVRVTFSRRGSWSMIGKEAQTIPKNEPTMNFGWLTPNSSDVEISSVVLHEFGHALGCFHEHQHPAGGIPWNKQAVYDYYAGYPNYWDKDKVDTNIFKTYAESVTNHTLKPDPLSIMMYPIDKKLTDGVYEVGFNSTLSEIDKSFISKLYQ